MEFSSICYNRKFLESVVLHISKVYGGSHVLVPRWRLIIRIKLTSKELSSAIGVHKIDIILSKNVMVTAAIRTYRRKRVLLNKGYWNFHIVNDELYYISTCHKVKLNDFSPRPNWRMAYNCSASNLLLTIALYNGTYVIAWRCKPVKRGENKQITWFEFVTLW